MTEQAASGLELQTTTPFGRRARALLRASVLSAVALGAQWAHADLASMPSGHYALDNTHGYITLSYTHLGFSHPSVGFTKFDVDLELDSAQPERSTLDVVIDAGSVDSRVEEFDGHLRGENFFQVDKFPEISFTATDIKMTGPDTGSITGVLTIRDIAKPVTLDVRLNKAGEHPMRKVPTLGLDAHGKVMRSAWGLDRAVPFVSDEVQISISVELLKANVATSD